VAVQFEFEHKDVKVEQTLPIYTCKECKSSFAIIELIGSVGVYVYPIYCHNCGCKFVHIEEVKGV